MNVSKIERRNNDAKTRNIRPQTQLGLKTSKNLLNSSFKGNPFSPNSINPLSSTMMTNVTNQSKGGGRYSN